jgi:hypothetical protein
VNFAIANVAASSTDAALSNPVTSATTAPVAGLKIRVYAMDMASGATATDVTLRSKPASGASTAISPTYALGASSGMVLPYNPLGHFDTLPGEGLGVTTGAGSTVAVHAVYSYLPGDAS